ncbi:MAG: DNA repair exonuclease [bacterium]|nr:DNA repair exonuclease [bacterium]
MTHTAPFTFIHTADWHIGNPFSRFGREMRKTLNRAILDTIEMIFMYAHKNGIPLMLCAGDAVDNGQLCAKEDLFKLFEIIKKYPGITVVMIAGNHDPLVPQNIYSRVDRGIYPENLHLVTGDETIDYPQWNISISAASLREKNGTYNPLAWLAETKLSKNVIQVGLCHGSIKNDAFAGNNFPIEPDSAQRVGLDYLALGDWHSFKKIDDRTYYPGVPEPLQMGDNGYPLAVTIDRPGAVPRVEQITNVSQYRWEQREETVTADNFAAFKTRLESVGEKEIHKLTVSGFLPLETYKTYKELIAGNRSRYMEINDQVRVQPDDHQLMEAADGFMSEIVRRLIQLKQSDDPLPDGILEALATGGQTEVFKLADGLTKEEIIDNALLMVYEYGTTARGSREKQS